MNQVTGRASVSTAVLLTAACLALAACGGGGSSTAAASPQAITFNAPGNQTLGTAPVALSASSDSALVVTLASTTPTVCTVSGTTLTLLAAGLCTVQASQAGNANYAAASDVTVSFTVYQPQTIAFAVGNQSLGSAPVALVATASSGLPVSFSTQTATVCSVSNTTLTLLSAGTCTLLADQPGNSVTAPAPTVTVSFNVAACVIAAPTAADIVSFNNPALTYTVAGFNGDAGAVVADPAGGCRKVGSVTRSAGSQYDGATFGTLAPASSPTIPAIGFTAVSNTMTMRVYVGAAPTLVHLKIENAANGAINYETEVNATQANTWQTLTFTLNAPLVNGLPGQAFNLVNTYNRVSLFFGFGSVQGPSAATSYFEDLSLVP